MAFRDHYHIEREDVTTHVEFHFEGDIQWSESTIQDYDDFDMAFRTSSYNGGFYYGECLLGWEDELYDIFEQLLTPLMPDDAGVYHISGNCIISYTVLGVEQRCFSYIDEDGHGQTDVEEEFTSGCESEADIENSIITDFQASKISDI